MDKGTGLLISDIPVPPKADPRLKLLHELEPRYRVFISNLTDTLSRQPSPPIPTTSRPGLFWDDVFIESQKPWRSFMESMLWHLVAVLIVWATSPGGVLQKTPLQQRRSYRDSHITYYPAARSAPPAQSSQARRAEPAKPARQKALAVAREHRHNLANPTAPDVNLNGRTSALNLAANGGPAPAVPLAATGRARLNLPADWTSVVAPPPDLGRARRHAPGLPQATVVAPAPDVGTVADQRPLAVPNAAVVAPPPTLQGWVHKIESLFGEGSTPGAGTQVVPPPPSIQGTDGAGGSRVSSLPGAGSQVVPPPPSVQGAGQNSGARMSAAPGVGGQVVPPPPNLQAEGGAGGRFGSLSTSGPQVVPPPPSVPGAGSGTSGRISSRLGGSGVGGAAQVVPPPPSVQAGGGPGSSRMGALSGSGAQVVPPPPSVQGSGSGGAGGRLGSLTGSGTQVVPPPPSVQGTGAGGGGRLGSLAGSGTQIVPPPPSVQGTGSGGGSRLGSLSGSGSQVVPPPPSVQGTGNGTGARMGSLSGTGSQVVPPPPAVQGAGTGNGGSGRVGSLSGSGSQVVPPPPSTQGAGDGGGGTHMAALSGAPDIPAPSGGAPGDGSVSTGPLQQMDDLPANPPQEAQVPSGPPPEDVPLRLINLVIPPKGSTFFSNYETFLAERRLANGKFEPIKLVYKFLPYQRRLSQYFAEGAKVHTLRVIRDKGCDEPLMEMLWPDGDPDQTDPQAVANAAAMNSIDRKTTVPCFVTTAEDYQRALERGR